MTTAPESDAEFLAKLDLSMRRVLERHGYRDTTDVLSVLKLCPEPMYITGSILVRAALNYEEPEGKEAHPITITCSRESFDKVCAYLSKAFGFPQIRLESYRVTLSFGRSQCTIMTRMVGTVFRVVVWDVMSLCFVAKGPMEAGTMVSAYPISIFRGFVAAKTGKTHFPIGFKELISSVDESSRLDEIELLRDLGVRFIYTVVFFNE